MKILVFPIVKKKLYTNIDFDWTLIVRAKK